MQSPSNELKSTPKSRRWFAHARAAGVGVALLATLGAGAACSDSNASTPAAANAAPTQAASSSSLQAYVANVCKATAQLEQSAGRFVGANGGAPTGNTPTDPAAGARTIQAAAAAYLDALKADNPPAELKDYNDQLVAEVEQAVGLIQNGNFGGGGGPGGPGANRPAGGNGSPVAPANGTPRARPSGTPGAGGSGGANGGFGGPGAGGQRGGGGIARVFLRNLPQPPANLTDQLTQAAAANPDCLAAGFTFGAN